MELRLLLAIVLSFVVFVAWGAYISIKDVEYQARIQQKEGSEEGFAKRKVRPPEPLQKEIEQPKEEIPSVFDLEVVRSTETKDIFIETDLYTIVLTNEGASFKNLKLKKYLNKKKEHEFCSSNILLDKSDSCSRTLESVLDIVHSRTDNIQEMQVSERPCFEQTSYVVYPIPVGNLLCEGRPSMINKSGDSSISLRKIRRYRVKDRELTSIWIKFAKFTQINSNSL